VTPDASLIEFLLNDDTSQVYGNYTNYNISDLSIDGILQRNTVQEHVKQAFTHNGVGYRAFILDYQDTGLQNTTTGGTSPGNQRVPPGSVAAPLDGISGEFTNALKELGYEEEDSYIESLSQVNFLNNVKAWVWIPIRMGWPGRPQVIKTDFGPKIKNIDLYQTCNIYKKSLPPPGSLVIVDYENRETSAGCTLKEVICDDATFCRIIMGELGGTVNEREAATYFAVAAGVEPPSIVVPEGDVLPLFGPKAAASPELIQTLAGYYDNDIPDYVPGKETHHLQPYNGVPGIEELHPDFIDYIKAFFWHAWNSLKIEMEITSTYRTYQQQQVLYDEYQRKMALPETDPESCDYVDPVSGEENKCLPASHPDKVSYHGIGMALDFSPIVANGSRLNVSNSKQEWINSGIPSIAQVANLRWGGDWGSWNIEGSGWDPIHVQFSNVVSDAVKKEIDALMKRGYALNAPELSLEQLGVKLV